MKSLASACHHVVLSVQQLMQMSYEKCSEFENNTIGHTTFVGRPTCQLGMPYMYD